MPNIFFTADTHFGHGNIIKYCNRPFRDARGEPDPQRQDEAIIQRFNSVLRPGDVLYHLGDVSWSAFDRKKGFLDRLNTKEVHLILGNHDKPEWFKGLPLRSVQEIKHLSIDKQLVILFHYPMRSWRNKGKGAFQLYGHVHGTMPGIGRQMDVGVDTNDFYPYSWDEIQKRLGALPYYPAEREV